MLFSKFLFHFGIGPRTKHGIQILVHICTDIFKLFICILFRCILLRHMPPFTGRFKQKFTVLLGDLCPTTSKPKKPNHAQEILYLTHIAYQ